MELSSAQQQHRKPQPPTVYTMRSFRKVSDLASMRRRIAILCKRLNLAADHVVTDLAPYCNLRKAYGEWKWKHPNHNDLPWFRFTPEILRSRLRGTFEEQQTMREYMILLDIFRIRNTGFDWRKYLI
jgi:hypothetical protein